MYTHLIFDLDGTLIESLPGIARALQLSLGELGHPVHDEATIRSFIGDGSLVLCERALEGINDADVAAVHARFLDHYHAEWKNGTQVFDGVAEMLKSLKKYNYVLSILSNKPHQFTVEIVESLFPEGTFDLVLGQREQIAKKPDPSGVHELLGELGQSSAKSVLVGDSTVDIITARNAGIHSIAVTWGYHDRKALTAVSPTHTVESVASLLEHLTPSSSLAFR